MILRKLGVSIRFGFDLDSDKYALLEVPKPICRFKHGRANCRGNTQTITVPQLVSLDSITVVNFQVKGNEAG